MNPKANGSFEAKTPTDKTKPCKVGLLLPLLIVLSSLSWAQVITGPEVSDPVVPYVIDIDLRDLPLAQAWKPGDPIKEIPRKSYDGPLVDVPTPEPRIDPLLQVQAEAIASRDQRAFSTTSTNFDGQGFTGVNPPDPTGAIGMNYYIQSINGSGGSVYVIYNKNDGSVAAGPFSMEALGAGACTSGAGDPIVLYDHLANRWLISEFAPQGANTLCVYISQTDDPINGGWFNYQFPTPNFPDYPKYGIWEDSYYVTSNEGGPSAIYAFDRVQMLAGAAAASQRFTVSDLAGFGFQALTPASLNGPAPPPGTPMTIMRHRDDEPHNPGANDPNQDFLEMYELSIDWVTPANSTLSGVTNIAVSEFDSDLCGLTSFSCFSQPSGGSNLDPLREVIMFPLHYRNFPTHQTLVGSFVTDVDGTDHGGVRWFELRKVGNGPWTLFQEGTYSIDNDDRWMASIGMDESGNMAMGYNVVGSTTQPGLRYVGRLAGDPMGSMPQGEFSIIEGAASNGSNRWGDYSNISLDPEDDCIFWFTGEYNQTTSWSTRIASFRFDACGCEQPDTPTALSVQNNGDNRIDLSWTASPTSATYNIYRGEGPCPQSGFQQIATGVAGTTYSDTTPSGGTTYSYVVTGYDPIEDCESLQSNCSDETATGLCFLAPQFAGLTSASNLQTQSCSIQLDWSPATSSCGAGISYNVYRSTSVDTLAGTPPIATCIAGTTYLDMDVEPMTNYVYMVRAEDGTANGSGPCNGGNEEGNTTVIAAIASGPDTLLFEDDMEAGPGNWLAEAGPGNVPGTQPWALNKSVFNSPTQAWFCSDEGSTKDQVLRLNNTINIPANTPAALEFWHSFNTESPWDGGVLEYSTDGTNWFDILAGDGAGVPANPDRFVEGQYTTTLNTSANPLGGRDSWSGDSSGFGRVTVDLADLTGTALRLRWRLGCDASVADQGWWVDDVRVFFGSSCDSGCPELSAQRPLWGVALDILDLIACLPQP